MPSIFSKFSPAKIFAKFFNKSESVLGIDIGSSSIKVVQLKKQNGKAILETYGELGLGPYAGMAVGQAVVLSTDKQIEAMRDILREANVTALRAAVALPLRSSLLKVIELPSYKEDQINRMVPIEARKHIPVPIAEVNLDWWAIPKREFQSPTEESSQNESLPEKTEVLLVAVHKTTVKSHQEIIATLGLTASTLEIETFSSMRSVLPRDISATALLDVGASSSKLTIVDYGIVRVSHLINHGGQDLTIALSASTGKSFAEAEKQKRKNGLAETSGLDNIFYEAATIIEDYQKRNARLVKRVICVGGGALILGFIERASKHFKQEVILGDPFAKVEAPAFLSEVLSQAGPEFAVAIGLALHELGEV